MEDLADENEEMAEVDFEAHGPNWLVGRSGRTRKTKKMVAKTGQLTNSADLEKMRKEIVAEMDDKMNKKLRKFFGRLVEANPSINVNFEELCAESSVEGSDKVDGSDNEDGEDQAEDRLDADDVDEDNGDENDEDDAGVDSDGDDNGVESDGDESD